MTTEITAVESALVRGDLSKLTEVERISYYRHVCQSLGLNPLTRPFGYITLNGKLTLYALKDCAEQLRKIHGISVGKPDIVFQEDWIIVTVEARNKDGRIDSDVGMVKKSDMQGNLGNAVMKAVTKAKRRVTLSICGLGILDETEVETIPDAKPVTAELPAPSNGADEKAETKRTAPITEHEYRAYAKKADIAQAEVNNTLRTHKGDYGAALLDLQARFPLEPVPAGK